MLHIVSIEDLHFFELLYIKRCISAFRFLGVGKSTFFAYFLKKVPEKFGYMVKTLYLCTRFSDEPHQASWGEMLGAFEKEFIERFK